MSNPPIARLNRFFNAQPSIIGVLISVTVLTASMLRFGVF